MTSRCCSDCIDDSFLRSEAVSRQPVIGQCDFCDAEAVPLLLLEELAEHFEPLLQLYEVDSSGAGLSLPAILRRDWGLFPTLTDQKASDLLSQIVPELQLGTATYQGPPSATTSVLGDWESFRAELMRRNRFFPSMKLEEDLDGDLFWLHLEADSSEVPTHFYRGRVSRDRTKLGEEEMGAPPPGLTRDGRANPLGIPYLYVASDTETAICELRPHPSEVVCVGRFEVIEELALVDLRNPKRTISPFRIGEDELRRVYGHISGLSQLGEELSRPILPRAAELEYLPSQYLSEFIKRCGFDGLIYRSAMGPGTNYALFAQDKTHCDRVRTYEIRGTTVDFDEIAGD